MFSQIVFLVEGSVTHIAWKILHQLHECLIRVPLYNDFVKKFFSQISHLKLFFVIFRDDMILFQVPKQDLCKQFIKSFSVRCSSNFRRDAVIFSPWFTIFRQIKFLRKHFISDLWNLLYKRWCWTYSWKKIDNLYISLTFTSKYAVHLKKKLLLHNKPKRLAKISQ